MTKTRHRGRPRKKEENFELVGIPKAMTQLIDKYRAWEKFQERYYITSRAEFIRRALSIYFEKLKEELGSMEEIE